MFELRFLVWFDLKTEIFDVQSVRTSSKVHLVGLGASIEPADNLGNQFLSSTEQEN